MTRAWFVLALLIVSDAYAQQVPRAALQYQRAMIGNARLVWGLNAPVAVLAGQVHAESGWRPEARSAFASGLAQFTPGTAADISRKYPELAGNAPLEPSWALRALARYDFDLYQLEPRAATECDRWGFTLSAYNGGHGWVVRQKAAAIAGQSDARRWFGHVERYRVRAVWAHTENVGYPRRILLTLQPTYRGWGRGVDCEVV